MTQIIAHRGASADAPENTLAAFTLALQQGAQAIELDVHLSADHVPVVIHDERLERTTNGKGLVASFNAVELGKLDAGDGESVPTLRQVLKAFTNQAVFYIELKTRESMVRVVEVIREQVTQEGWDPQKLVVISPDLPMLDWLRLHAPEIVSVLPCQTVDTDIAAYLKPGGPDYLSVNHTLIDEAYIRQVTNAELRILAWTVNDIPQMKRLIQPGVYGIITDRPAVLHQLLCGTDHG